MSTIHASPELTVLVVADHQLLKAMMPEEVKTLLMYGADKEVSNTLFSSTTEGRRHPPVPPTVLLAQTARAWGHTRLVKSMVCSHTKPVLLSRTA